MLHLNLYNELQKQEQARQRDPVKLVALGVVLFVLLLISYYGYRRSVVAGLETQIGGIKDEWARLGPQQIAAHAREVELLAQQKINQALIDRLQGRFFWAPFMERFGKEVPPFIQITSFTGSAPARGKPIGVLIAGVAAGAQPRSVAEQFRNALQQKLAPFYDGMEVVFDSNSLEDSTQTVAINGQTLATATFRMRLSFKPEPPPTPTPAPTAAPRVRRHQQ